MMIPNRYFILLLTGIILLLAASCSRQTSKLTAGKDIVIYPIPPDTARIQYLTSISHSVQIIGKRSSFSRFIVGEDAPLPINKPYGIAIHKGKIYVCDAGIRGLEIIDLEKRSFEYFNPKGRGQLTLPINCFVDDRGMLYVTDGGRNQIVIFDNERNFLASFGEPADQFRPTDVFVTADKIWVSNSKGNKVNVYTRDTYQLLYSFPDSQTGKEDFLYTPTNICVTGDKVYVSDIGDFNVKKYSYEGKFISTVGSFGKNIGQFVRPKGIAVDRESNLFVVDAGFENTQIFNDDGKLLMFFGGPYNGPGDMWLPAKVIIDYDNLKYFQKYVDQGFTLKYLVLVTNQYGPDKISVYGAVEPRK